MNKYRVAMTGYHNGEAFTYACFYDSTSEHWAVALACEEWNITPSNITSVKLIEV